MSDAPATGTRGAVLPWPRPRAHPVRVDLDRGRHRRLLAVALALPLGLVVTYLVLLATVYPSELGGDFRMYLAIAHRVLAGGPLYEARQLAGPYVTAPGDSMYPPVAFPLFAAFTVLPAVLWWALPLGVVGWRVWRERPTGWRLAAILWLLAWPQTLPILWTGNPVMWAMVGLALPGRWWSWTVLLKPSVFPFALLGARDRRWWFAVACLAVASVAVLPLTLQWVAVVLNARGEWAGPFYALSNVPLLLAVRLGCQPSRGSSVRLVPRLTDRLWPR